MKARASSLPPEMERYVRESVERQIKLEAGYVTESLVCIAALVLSEEPYNFGRKRLEDYCERIHARVKELTRRYGNDWPEAAMAALEKKEWRSWTTAGSPNGSGISTRANPKSPSGSCRCS